jgi:uncharacterized membrane protein
MSLAPLGAEVVFMAWTEPLTLVLLFAASLTWKRSTVWSGILLGLALASKQYLIFFLPLLILHRDDGWRPRATAAIASAAATVGVGMVMGPSSFLQSTLGNLAGIGFRPDTQSLPGLANELGIAFLLPNWLWIGVSLAVMALLARSSRSRADFFLRGGLGLGIALLVGQAFPNYWYLVAGMMVIGSLLEVGDASAAESVSHPHGRRHEARIAGA